MLSVWELGFLRWRDQGSPASKGASCVVDVCLKCLPFPPTRHLVARRLQSHAHGFLLRYRTQRLWSPEQDQSCRRCPRANNASEMAVATDFGSIIQHVRHTNLPGSYMILLSVECSPHRSGGASQAPQVIPRKGDLSPFSWPDISLPRLTQRWLGAPSVGPGRINAMLRNVDVLQESMWFWGPGQRRVTV
jgi:hypothetical protein